MLHPSSILLVAAVVVSCLPSCVAEEPWQVFETPTKSSLRGLAAIDRNVAWACGSKGAVVRTIDGGRSWNAIPLPGLDMVEIRSIHLWDGDQAIVATAGQPARILKTTDGGQHWDVVFEHASPQAFIDGLRFWDSEHGIAFSDPIDGRMLMLTSEDRGKSWVEVPNESIPAMLKNEAGFAASNSSLTVYASGNSWIGLGGDTGHVSRVFRSQDRGQKWTAHDVSPIRSNASSGIFSVNFASENIGVAVGGDYRLDSNNESNIGITDDGGLTWREPKTSRPRGFRSCVVSLVAPEAAKPIWIACGPRGCDWSTDRESWHALSDTGFHTLTTTTDGTLWAAGSDGRVGIMTQDAWSQRTQRP